MEQVSQNDVAFVNKFISWNQCINSIWTPTRNFYQKYLKKCVFDNIYKTFYET